MLSLFNSTSLTKYLSWATTASALPVWSCTLLTILKLLKVLFGKLDGMFSNQGRFYIFSIIDY